MSTTGRHLAALTAIQAQPGISASRLSGRLGVTERTARRDVAALRELGYRIDAVAGRFGGYRLAAGTAMPPLVLDADEALAVALGLRTQVGVSDLGPAAATALAKVEASVPSRVRVRLAAVVEVEVAPDAGAGSRRDADPDVFVPLALACRAHEAVRLRHRRTPGGPDRARDLQPFRLVAVRGRWYLVGCERGAPAWRTYALDRISDVRPLGTRLPTPDLPADATAFVVAALAHGRRYLVRVRAFTAGDVVRGFVHPSVASVEDDGDDCVLSLRTDDLDAAARWLVHLGVDLDVLEPVELQDRLHALGTWLAARYA